MIDCTVCCFESPVHGVIPDSICHGRRRAACTQEAITKGMEAVCKNMPAPAVLKELPAMQYKLLQLVMYSQTPMSDEGHIEFTKTLVNIFSNVGDTERAPRLDHLLVPFNSMFKDLEASVLSMNWLSGNRELVQKFLKQCGGLRIQANTMLVDSMATYREKLKTASDGLKSLLDNFTADATPESANELKAARDTLLTFVEESRKFLDLMQEGNTCSHDS